MNSISAKRIKAARAIAISADVLQIVCFPLFAEGFISIVDDILDVVVCIALTILVGWHISFLPSFLLKVVPFADLVPTWTIAVLIATRGNAHPQTTVYAEPPQPPLLK